MQAVEKTKEELVAEVAHLRQRVAELEASERERKQVEKALKRSEQEKATVFDSITELVAYQDTKMRVQWANRAAGESVDVDPQQLVGRHCYEIWQQRRKPCVGCPVVEARKSGQPQETEMTTPDGRVWFIRGYPVRDTQGNITGAVEVTLEITERKKAEEKAAKARIYLDRSLSSAPDGVFLIDKQEIYTYVNPTFLKMIGYKEKDIVGKSIQEIVPKIIPPGSVEIILERVKKRLETGESIVGAEIEILNKEGKKIPASYSASGIKDDQGNVIGEVVFLRDITERKRAEEALEESEKRFRNIFETIPVSIIVLDKDGQMVDINPYHLTQIAKGQTPKGDFIGKNIVTHPTIVKSGLSETYKKVFEGEPFDRKDVFFPLLTTGADGYFNVRGVPLLKDDKVIGAVVIHEDITERKKADEERLAHLRFLESMDQFNQTLQGTNDLDQMMNNALGVLLTIFDCERAWLLYPCDPEATSWRVPKERTQPGYPGVFAMGTEIPMDTGAAKMMQRALDSDAPVKYGPGLEYPLPEKEPKRFGIQSQLAMAIYPKVGKPWLFGLHQCSYVRVWTPQEEQLFQEIGHRLTDGLTSLLMYRDLKERENQYRKLANSITDVFFAMDTDLKYTYWNNASENLTGIKAEVAIGKTIFEVFPDTKETRKAAAVYKDVLKKKQPKSFENEYRLEDKHYFFEINAYPTKGGISVFAKDITERKRMEEELRESEDRFRTIVETAPSLLMISDTEGKNIYVSPNCEEITGYTQEELLGSMKWWVHEDDTERAQKVFDRTLREMAGNKNFEYKAIRKNGDVWYASSSWEKLKDSEGKFKGVVIQTVDITERKQAEEELRESEEKYRSLVESSEDSIYLVDNRCKYIFLNNRHLSRLGVKMKQIIGRPYAELHSPEESQDFTQRVKTVVKTGQSLTYEYSSQRDNRYFIRTLSPVASPDSGLIQAITVISKDITERKQAEVALQESEERYRTLVDHIDLGINLIDSDHNIIMVNATMGDKFNKSVREIIGKKCFAEFEKRKSVCPHCPGVQTMATAQTAEVETEGVRDDGSRFDVRLQTFPVVGGDRRVTSFIEIAEDITERKEAEEKLREREAFNYALFHYNPVETIVVDLEGKVTAFNLAKETSGDRLPAIGDRMYKDYAGKHEIDMRTELMRCIKSGESKEFSERKYGDKYLNITITPFAQGAIIISEDITERKQAEALLQKERDTFYSILERVPSGVMVEDAYGNFSFINSEFTYMTGYTLEDIPSRQEWLRRAYPDKSYRNMVKKKWEKNHAQSTDQETFHKRFKRVFPLVFTVMCKDGAYKEIEFRATARGDEGTIFMLSDITERQRMHDLLETAASEWRTTFDAINDAVCLLDPHGKIIRCNNAMLQFMGKPFSQIKNHHCWEVIHGVSEAPHSCPIALVGRTHHRETEAMFKDSHWFNISVDPLLDEEGNIFGCVHIMSDITERMRIQNELQDSREQLRNLTVYLQSVREQERTNIAREIHDELAQALTALKMDVSWLDHRLPSDAQSLSEKTKSMDKLIDSTIHTVKRISAELRPGVLDDLGLVAAIEWQAEEFQNRTGISCNVTVDPPDLTVDQDRSTAIFRIFQETLTNVARHARATRVSVGLKERGGRLTLRVRDNGTGITEERITNPKSFGLIGIRERVHPWGGKVSIKGIPGKGTTLMVNMELTHSKHDVEKSELKGSPS